MNKSGNRYTGLFFAVAILVMWTGCLVCFLLYPVNYSDPFIYLFVLVQTHLYTGVFITMHDAIHGVVLPGSKKVNSMTGWICSTLFAFNNYSTLSRKHHLHHKYSVSEKDPDYATGSFFTWYGKFLLQYLTVLQFVLMAVAYNFLKLVFEEPNLLLFWALPSILSTFQLFYFGTYLPHRGIHASSNIHRARSQKLNHFVAFVTCYFFGYHYEHHAYPWLPWWKLPEARENRQDLRIKQDGQDWAGWS